MEVLVIIVGLLMGYWIVSALMDWKQKSSGSSSGTAHEQKRSDQEQNTSREGNYSSTSNADDKDYIRASWFRILGVSENASKDQVATAYKVMISQYHPDKVAQMGTEIRELAEFKSKQINAAYDYAMKLRG